LTDEKDSAAIKKSLDETVQKLEQDPTSSERWGSTTKGHQEDWESLKSKIKNRQRALKALVMEKKAGSIGQDEFDRKYREIQDELTKLEFQVYNMRLGTNIEL
jgi:ribosome recycling factor